MIRTLIRWFIRAEDKRRVEDEGICHEFIEFLVSDNLPSRVFRRRHKLEELVPTAEPLTVIGGKM